jgi:hypothetical protein
MILAPAGIDSLTLMTACKSQVLPLLVATVGGGNCISVKYAYLTIV